MTEDKDIKRMFEAQRQIDKVMTPSFDALVKEHEADDIVVPICTDRNFVGLPVPTITLAAIVLVIVVGLAAWINSQNHVDAVLATPTDMQELNCVCDSLLARIEQLNPEVLTDFGTLEEEMDWHTGTDSLITITTSSFNVRKSP